MSSNRELGLQARADEVPDLGVSNCPQHLGHDRRRKHDLERGVAQERSRIRPAVLRAGWRRLVKEFEGIARPAKRKLEALHAAARLDDLRVPPSNRLEKLKGDLKAFHSIRINDQWRIIFRWIDGHAHGATIVDYH